MGRIWAFAKEGTEDHNSYLKSKGLWSEGLHKVLGEKHPSERRVNNFVSRIVSKAERKNEGDAEQARQLLLKHFSASDILLSNASVKFGVRHARTLALKPGEKALAALFIARTHHALARTHRDPEALSDFMFSMNVLHEKQGIEEKIDVRNLYEFTVKRRLNPLARIVKELPSSKRPTITLKKSASNSKYFLKSIKISTAIREETPHLARQVFGLCDVPEALWLGEKRLLQLRSMARSP